MTTVADLTIVEPGVAELSGILDFSSVPLLWPQLEDWLAECSTAKLSLRDVSACNSAALALLLEAMSYAAKQNIIFSLHDIPSELLDLARLSNVDELLLAQPSTSDYAKH